MSLVRQFERCPPCSSLRCVHVPHEGALGHIGELHIVDFGKPHNAYARLVSFVMGRFEEAADNVKGRLPEMFRQAGLDRAEETARYTTPFGTLSLYHAWKPG